MSDDTVYSGVAKVEVCRDLGDDWRDLADILDIPVYQQHRFAEGQGPKGVWEWLELRGELRRLPAALGAVGRPDLVSRLARDKQLEREARPAGYTGEGALPPLRVVSVRGDLVSELGTLDLDAADWCVLASATGTARELLASFVEEADDDPAAGALARELGDVLEALSTGPTTDDGRRAAHELRDALIDTLTKTHR